MANSDLDGEWLEALEVEDTGDDNNSGGDDDDAKTDDNAVGNADNDEGADEGAGADDDKGEGGDDSSGDDAKPPVSSDDEAKTDDEKVDTPPAPSEDDKYKEAVKQAMQEMEASKVDRDTKFSTYKSEVEKTLYPEGINRQLRDSDGDPIRGIDDLTKLINPETRELFTEDEAGRWLLAKQQELNRDVEAVEKFIEEVAETNIRIEEGADRVVKKYGEFLNKNPDLKDRLLAGYNKTIVKDPNSGVAIKAPVDVEDYFDTVIEPILKQQKAEADEAAKANKEAEERAKKNAQNERGDFKPSGKADVIPPEDKEWAEAIKEYEEGA